MNERSIEMIVSTNCRPRCGLVGIVALLTCLLVWAAGGTAAPAANCPTVTYRSAPTLGAQRVCENLGVSTRGTMPGSYLFLTQNGALGAGAGIFQDNGDLVWWLSTGGMKDHNMTVVDYQGQPYIGLWTGRAPGAGTYGVGSVTLYDEHYQVAGRITISGAHGASGIDLHEFQITPEGDALVGSYPPIRMRVAGRVVTVLGYLVEKWSLVRDAGGIHLGRRLLAWNAINDVPVSDSHVPEPGRGGIWDYFHGNGITEAPDGDLLVSGRNTWGIYEVDARRGTPAFDHVLWQIGAVHDSKLTVPWCYQHDVAALGHGIYSVYDDGGGGPGCMPGATQHPARGLIFSVNTSRQPVLVHLIRAYTHHPPIYTAVTGSMQTLGNGDALLDWGNVPETTEYGSGGNVKMDLSLSGRSYRGLRFAWNGQPTWPPAVAAQESGSGTNVWASWNGSTEVAAWQLLAGPDGAHLSPVGSPVRKGGFETGTWISGHYATLAVQALNSNGAVLATSDPTSG